MPQFAAAVVDSVELGGDLVTFRVRAKAGDAACSGCRRRSSRVHARYQRQLADLPLGSLSRFRRPLLATAAALTLAALTVVSFRQVSYWKESITLWNRSLAVTPDNLFAEDYLGRALFHLKQYDQAAQELAHACQDDPAVRTERSTSATSLQPYFVRW